MELAKPETASAINLNVVNYGKRLEFVHSILKLNDLEVRSLPLTPHLFIVISAEVVEL